jgi:hypothetical protein
MTDNPNKPPEAVQRAAEIVSAWLKDQPVPGTAVTTTPAPRQQIESAIQKYMGTERSDTPPERPAWDGSLAFAGNAPPQRAADRFMQQRRDRGEKPALMPPWRDPRGDAA